MKHAIYTSAVHGHDFVKDPRTVGFSSETMITRGTNCPVVFSPNAKTVRVNQTEKRTVERWLREIKLDRGSLVRPPRSTLKRIRNTFRGNVFPYVFRVRHKTWLVFLRPSEEDRIFDTT